MSTNDTRHWLYFGECLALMERFVKSEHVDLVYLDPPWQPKRVNNVLHREQDGSESAANVEVFDRTWRWGLEAAMAEDALIAMGGSIAAAVDGLKRMCEADDSKFAYLVQMGRVLTEVHRVMKPGASMYLHCDALFNAPLRMLGDAVFQNGFRREIIRTFRTMPANGANYRRGHETIFYYSKGERPKTFNTEYEPPAESTMERMNGRKQYLAPGASHKEQLPEPCKPTLRDVWDIPNPWDEPAELWDVPILAAASKEKVPGFKTQKPIDLLKRIVSVSSNPDDLVLDPFCGSGVTLYASHLLRRRSICMDITHVAIARIRERLATVAAYSGVEPEEYGDPIDVAGARALAAKDKNQFQDWAGRRLGASGRHQPGADGGVDDRIRFRDGGQTHLVIVSVKGGGVKPTDVDALQGVVGRTKNAAIGVLVILDAPTREVRARAESKGFWVASDNQRYPATQIMTVEDLIDRRRIHMPTPLNLSDVPQNQRYHERAVQGRLF